MSGSLLLVDADSMLFRAFYALPKTIEAPDGTPVNALLGTANLVLREYELHRPRTVVMCFGAEAAEYRVELYSGYHADRIEMPPELGPQFADAPRFFASFGWTIGHHPALEADDLLGAYARREARQGGEALVMTGDRDLFQCASDRITVLYVRTGASGAERVTPAEVRRRYGVPPELVPDFIALRGDPSDGIPGAKGVGEKTAADLLRRHGSLEQALEGALREQRTSLRAALGENRERLLAFKEIATLRDVEVEVPPDSAPDFAAAAGAARERGMRRLAERLERMTAGARG